MSQNTTPDYDRPGYFHRSARPTMGVEWEIGLVDQDSFALVHAAPQVITQLDQLHPRHGVEKEFLTNTIELVTGVSENTAAAMAQIDHQITIAQAAAAEAGALLWGSGTHPFSRWEDAEVSDNPLYERIIERNQYWGRQMMIWGVHVHVGISHEAKVMPIIHELMLRYPHMLALSASSPMWQGVNTGYASNRTMLYQQLPTAGIPYGLETWPQWSSYLTDQMHSGVIDNPRQLHWDIRPAPRHGTIEVRVCDGVTNRRELAALAAFIHCLVVEADQRIEAGVPFRRLQPWFVKENKWRAARYGLDAEIITSRECAENHVVTEIERTLNRLEPIATQLGCADELALVAEIPARGAAYQRQLQVLNETGELREVVRATAAEMNDLRLD